MAVVTGGAKGIGKAICEKFGAEGALVIVNDVNLSGAQEVAAAICSSGGRALANEVDATRQDQVVACIDRLVREIGPIDVLVNNVGGVVGTGPSGTKAAEGPELWSKAISLNFCSTLYYCLAVIPHMRERKKGKIINFSSIGCFYPTAAVLEYHAAKGAVESLTRNLAFQLAPCNINVNVIVPGPIRTELWEAIPLPEGLTLDDFANLVGQREVPLGRVGTPQDVAGVALFLASELSDFLTGERIHVAGGMPNVLAQAQTVGAGCGLAPVDVAQTAGP